MMEPDIFPWWLNRTPPMSEDRTVTGMTYTNLKGCEGILEMTYREAFSEWESLRGESGLYEDRRRKGLDLYMRIGPQIDRLCDCFGAPDRCVEPFFMYGSAAIAVTKGKRYFHWSYFRNGRRQSNPDVFGSNISTFLSEAETCMSS